MTIAQNIIEEIEQQKDLEKGTLIAGYMKTSDHLYMGVLVPDIRRTAKKHIKNVPVEDLIPVMKELWKERVFEHRLAAIQIMEKYSEKGDIDTAFDLISEMVDSLDTWAMIDPLCIVCQGNLIIRDRSVEEKWVSWRKSENIWKRRATVLPYVHLSKKTKHKPEYNTMILRAMKPHLSDSEFFVGKAVGWVLRELSKREPELVRSFIDEHKEKMSKLSIREGSKKLPK
jgi:3-methyladenine DNA glycosylase AlkD